MVQQRSLARPVAGFVWLLGLGVPITLGVLVGSTAAAVMGALILGLRSRAYRLMYEQEQVDDDADGIPDMYQREQQS